MILISLGDSIEKPDKNKFSIFQYLGANKNRKNKLHEFTENKKFKKYIRDLTDVSVNKDAPPDIYLVNVRFHIFRFLGNVFRSWLPSNLFSWIVNKKPGYKLFCKDILGSPFDLLINVNCEEQFRGWVRDRTDTLCY